MCFAPNRVDTTPLFEILDILNHNQTYKLESGKFMFKEKNNLLPVLIANYFDPRPIHQHSLYTRNNGLYQGPLISFRTQLGARTIQNKGQDLWDTIPDSIKEVESPVFFKRKYKEHLLLTS